MAADSPIEWTTRTWNPIAGCSVVSPGCTNCYAMRRVAPRLAGNPATPHYHGTVAKSKAGYVWSGKIGISEKKILEPLSWKTPALVFVNSTSDLFHEDVPDEVIDRIFAVMALTPHITYQVLTKRAARAREYLLNRLLAERLQAAAFKIDPEKGATWCADIQIAGDRCIPLPNVWLGVSVEDQPRADERIPLLLDTPAAIRFVSAEPLLGKMDIERWLSAIINKSQSVGQSIHLHKNAVLRPALDWVIGGGETGTGSRPMHPDWARSLRDQCAAANVPFFFKQWGDWVPSTPERAAGNPRSGWRCLSAHPHVPKPHELYPENGAAFIERVGKKAAGRLLDGVEHNAMPGEAEPSTDGRQSSGAPSGAKPQGGDSARTKP